MKLADQYHNESGDQSVCVLIDSALLPSYFYFVCTVCLEVLLQSDTNCIVVSALQRISI